MDRRAALALLALLPACGGAAPHAARPAATRAPSQSPTAPTAVATHTHDDGLPWVSHARHVIRPRRRCSTGPFDVEVHALGADRAEQVAIYACGPRELEGHVRIDDWDAHWGYAGSSDFPLSPGCRAVDGDVVHTTTVAIAPPPPATPPATRAHRRRADAAPAAPAAAPAPLDYEVQDVAVDADYPCAGLTEVTRSRYQSEVGRAYVGHGGVLHVQLWSELPNDLEGVTFVIEQRSLDPSVTAERWREFREAENARWRAAPATPAPRIAAPPAGPTVAPPALRADTETPRPSVHAAWIPGYWRWGAATWAWVDGFWRVPEEDIRARLTARAPTAPPPPRVEAPAAPPPDALGAVWATGSWEWNGSAWAWTEGKWRLPPAAGEVWVAPAWQAFGGGVILVPGGWTLQ